MNSRTVSSRTVGYTLVELIVAVAVASLMLTVGVVQVRTLSGEVHLRVAAGTVSALLHSARSEAVRRGIYVGLRFERRGNHVWEGVYYQDGDGDGIRSADIRSGVDEEIGRRPVSGLDSVVRFGIIAEMAPTDPGDSRRRLSRLDDPVRFGRSDIASFGPLGTATPGSIYLRDGSRRQAVVRLFGRTGKLRVLHYDPTERIWNDR